MNIHPPHLTLKYFEVCNISNSFPFSVKVPTRFPGDRRGGYCLYCEGFFEGGYGCVTEHYEDLHRQQPAVMAIEAMNSTSALHQEAWVLLENMGNFRHNVKVCLQWNHLVCFVWHLRKYIW